MSKPVIFLDIDGVLNHRAVFIPKNGLQVLCPLACRRFLAFVEESSAHTVLSSTWRKFPDYVSVLKAKSIMDSAHKDWRTVELPWQPSLVGDHPKRGDEIKEWLDRHPEVDNYVILDDDSDMLTHQMPRFVKTSFETGLLDEHIVHARRILTGG